MKLSLALFLVAASLSAARNLVAERDILHVPDVHGQLRRRQNFGNFGNFGGGNRNGGGGGGRGQPPKTWGL